MENPEFSSRLVYTREKLRLLFQRRTVYLFFLANLVLLIIVASLLVWAFEKNKNPSVNTFGDAVWLQVVTMTTVGYGDVYPVTPAGRTTEMISMILGIGLLSSFITAMASMRVQKAQRRAKGLETSVKFSNHYIVCGWNRRGPYVLARLKEELEPQRIPVVLLCNLDENPAEDEYFFFIKGNQVERSALERANVGRARGVILLADESRGGERGDIDARTVLAALNVRSINPAVRVTSEVLETENIYHLTVAGVGEILDSNVITGNLMARPALHYGLIEMMTDLVERRAGAKVFRLPVGEDLIGIGFKELLSKLKAEYGALLLSVVSPEGLARPTGEAPVRGDFLLVLAEEKPPGAAD